jgi:hypothetical protein
LRIPFLVWSLAGFVRATIDAVDSNDKHFTIDLINILPNNLIESKSQKRNKK